MPHDNLRDALESLRTLTPRLNSVTDLANATIRDVEKFLNDELSVGIYAAVRIENHDEEGRTWSCLEYRRIGPRFRISIVHYDHGEQENEKAWADSNRHDKLASFAKLPDLLAEIAQKVDVQLKATELTAQAVAASIAASRNQTVPSSLPVGRKQAEAVNLDLTRRRVTSLRADAIPPLKQEESDIPF